MATSENASNKTENTNEAPKMRRVRNNINRSNNPAVLFASGLEGLVRDQMHNPSKYDEQEQRVMERKANKKTDNGNLFNILCRQFFSSKMA